MQLKFENPSSLKPRDPGLRISQMPDQVLGTRGKENESNFCIFRHEYIDFLSPISIL